MRLMQEVANSIRIRRGTATESSAVSSLLKQAFAEYKHLYTIDGYAATTPEPAAIAIRMREGPLWIGLCGECIVGTASAMHKDAGLYIRGMGVLPTARDLGIGRLLLQEIEHFARANGYRRMFLSTTPFLDRAIRLYRSFGFERIANERSQDLFGTPLFTMEKVLESAAAIQDHQPRPCNI